MSRILRLTVLLTCVGLLSAARARARPGPTTESAGIRWRRRLARHRQAAQAQGPARQDRHPRFLDPLLNQLHPRHSRPGQVGKEVSESARRHRRPLAQVRQREGPREHPQGDAALRGQPPRRQRRQSQDLDHLQRAILADRRAHRPRRLSGRQAWPPRRSIAELDKAIEQLIRIYRARRTLNERKPMRSEEASAEKRRGPLFFPGKVLADAASKRLFIADSTHHRIVITDLDGKKIAIAGTRQRRARPTARSPRPASTIRRAWPSTATRSTSPTARTT